MPEIRRCTEMTGSYKNVNEVIVTLKSVFLINSVNFLTLPSKGKTFLPSSAGCDYAVHHCVVPTCCRVEGFFSNHLKT